MGRHTPNAEAHRRVRWTQMGSTVATIFVVAVLGNYLWKLTQVPLCVGLKDIRTTLWHCFVPRGCCGKDMQRV